MHPYMDTRMRMMQVIRSVINKMNGSSLIEDPGIPLVDRRNGKYSKYGEDDGFSPRSTVSSTENKFDNISYRLSRRKQLLRRRRIIIDIEFALAMVGIILMMVETELFIANVITKSSALSIILKSCVSISTVVLLVAVICYHATGIQLHMTDNGLEDWRLAVSFPWTYFKISLELLICVIHPIPGNITTTYYDPKNGASLVSLDAFLSILMLLRLYLLGKFIVAHSRMLTDTSTQSLGALNKVKINTVFVFKALMSTMPGTMLSCIMLMIFVVHTWAMRTCEVYYHPDLEHSSILNSMWVIAITFLTVGYGDIYPNSYCGRFVSVSTGLMGVGTTALLVAVLAQKLEQSRAEKYVHIFVSQIQLDKDRKNAAADVIKYVIRLWRMRKKGDGNDKHRIHVHGKLIQAIHSMREAKNETASIREGAIGAIEISKTVNDVYTIVETMQEDQKEFKEKVEFMDEKLSKMDAKMDDLLDALFRR